MDENSTSYYPLSFCTLWDSLFVYMFVIICAYIQIAINLNLSQRERNCLPSLGARPEREREREREIGREISLKVSWMHVPAEFSLFLSSSLFLLATFFNQFSFLSCSHYYNTFDDIHKIQKKIRNNIPFSRPPLS